MIKLVLFDVDGVFLSEERCFDASALSIWELLKAPHFLGIDAKGFTDQPTEEQIRQIRSDVFQQNKVLDWMKSKGINSNWDMVFLGFSGQLLWLLKELYTVDPNRVRFMLKQSIGEKELQQLSTWMREESLTFLPSFDQWMSLFPQDESIEKHELLIYFNTIVEKWFGISVDQFSRNSALWELGRSVYQEWYLGTKQYQETETMSVRNQGKMGFLEQEIPLAKPQKIRQMLDQLAARGVKLGIGTGRPRLETVVPLESLELLPAFESDRIASATDVIEAETAHPDQAPLGKPHPYTYLRAYHGRDVSDETCLSTSLPLEDGQEILIVGDSVADYLAAKQMGCQFAATLTGLTGQAARGKFEELEADYIFDDVTQVISLFSANQ